MVLGRVKCDAKTPIAKVPGESQKQAKQHSLNEWIRIPALHNSLHRNSAAHFKQAS